MLIRYSPVGGTDVARLVPLNIPFDIFDVLELVTQFDDGKVDHTGIETQGAADRRLDWPRGIEAHDEVVAFAVSSLVLGGDLRQTECTPVGEAADNAAGADDLGTGITSNSVKEIS